MRWGPNIPLGVVQKNWANSSPDLIGNSYKEGHLISAGANSTLQDGFGFGIWELSSVQMEGMSVILLTILR